MAIRKLDRPDMTYTNPGRKGNVYIEKIDGERCYVEKRYLLWNLQGEVLRKFKVV